MFFGKQTSVRLLGVTILIALLFGCDDDKRELSDRDDRGSDSSSDSSADISNGELEYAGDPGSEGDEVLRTVIDETMEIRTVVFGHARDQYRRPLPGVTVRLMGDNLYETTTDEHGYFRIPNVYIGSARALIGQAATGDADDNSDRLQINNDYILNLSHEGMATSTTDVDLEANLYRTPNSYAYETAPFGFEGILVPYATATVKVITGESAADGSPVPASGARVEILRRQSDALRFDSIGISRVADENGVVEITSEDMLPATAGYRLVVMPYDSNPEENDGTEYDTVFQEIDLAPYSYFRSAPNGNYEVDHILVTLRDGRANNAAPSIAYTEPAEDDKIAPASPIRVVFSRPVDTSTLEYRITGCVNAACNGGSAPLLTNELSRTPTSFSFQISDAHSHLFDGFRLQVNVQTLDGITLADTIDYDIDDSVRPLDVAVPMPMLNLESADGSTSESYFAAVDAASIFVADRDEFDAESFRGTIFSSLAGSLDPALGNTGLDLTLPIKFSAVAEAVGYRFFVRDFQYAVSWLEVGQMAADIHPVAAGDMVLANVNLSNYMSLYNVANESPFCCGNVVQLAVLPYFGQSDVNQGGAIDVTRIAALDSNAILSLTDTFGPGIFPENDGLFGDRTEFANLEYDEMATVAFSERMDGAAGIPELQTEGRYAIEFARWVVEENYTTLRVQLATRFVSAEELYLGDRIRTIDGDCTVEGIELCGATPLVYCGGDEYSEADYELLGPIREEAEFEDFDIFDGDQPGNSFVVNEFLDDSTLDNRSFFAENFSRWAFVVGGVSYPVRPRLGFDGMDEKVVVLREPLRQAVDFSSQTVELSNHVNLELTAALSVAAEGTTEAVRIELSTIEGLALNQVISIFDADPAKFERVQIVGLNPSTSEVTVNAQFNHAAGTRAALHYAAKSREPAAVAGQAIVELQNLNGVPSFWHQPRPGCANFSCYRVTITAPDGDVQTALVTNVENSTLTLSGDLTGDTARGLDKDVPAGSIIEIVERRVSVNQALLNVRNLDGVRAKSSITVSVGQGTLAASGSATFDTCGAGKINGLNGFLLSSNARLADVTVSDTILGFADGDLRVGDKLTIVGSDAAGNGMRANADELMANGDVE